MDKRETCFCLFGFCLLQVTPIFQTALSSLPIAIAAAAPAAPLGAEQWVCGMPK
jgi:hypothetical protein